MSEIQKVEDEAKKLMTGMVHGIQHLFSKDHLHVANQIIQGLSKLVTFVGPLAEELASKGGSTTNLHLVQAAENMNTSVKDILAKVDQADRDGSIQTLLLNATESVVAKAAETGTVDLGPIGKFETGSTVTIPKHYVDTAGSLFYTAFVAPTTPTPTQ
jgi:hypothetical protein